MASETVKQVVLAESDADNMLAEAKNKGNKIIEDARKYADNALQEQLQLAHAAAQKMKESNRSEIDVLLGRISSEGAQSQENVRRQASENMSAAVRAVTDMLINY